MTAELPPIAFLIGMVVLYFAIIATLVFICGFIILWLLQQFHVIGGCVC